MRKARTRLRHELQLSDAGTTNYHGQQLDQSAVEMACADLDDPDRLRAWHRLSGLAELSRFLSTGHAEPLLTKQAQYARLTSDQDLLEFRRTIRYPIRPGAGRRLPRGRRAVAAPAGCPTATFQAHPASTRHTQYRPDVARDHHRMRGTNPSSWPKTTTPPALCRPCAEPWSRLAGQLRWQRCPNCWPTRARRSCWPCATYAIALFNIVDDPTSAALLLLRKAATVPTDARTLDRVREDIRQIEEIERGRIARGQRDAWIEEYNAFYGQLTVYKKSSFLYFAEADLRSLRRWVPELTAFITRLNALNDDEVAEARTALAWEIRGLTVGIWNKNQAFGSTALLLVNAGLTFGLQQR